MSGITSGIAASVSQAAVQQGQVARARDSAGNADAHQARVLRQLLEQHVSEVENSTETTDQTVRVREEERHAGQQRRRRHQKDRQDQAELSSAATQAASEQESATPDNPADPPLYQHLDIQA